MVLCQILILFCRIVICCALLLPNKPTFYTMAITERITANFRIHTEGSDAPLSIAVHCSQSHKRSSFRNS
jgi:hypothetical protein